MKRMKNICILACREELYQDIVNARTYSEIKTALMMQSQSTMMRTCARSSTSGCTPKNGTSGYWPQGQWWFTHRV